MRSNSGPACTTQELLVTLGELTPNHNLSFAQYIASLGQRHSNPMGALEEVTVCEIARIRENHIVRSFDLTRGKPEDCQRNQGETRRNGRDQRARWRRDRIYCNLRLYACVHELDARIGNARRSRIRHQSHILPGLEPR